MASWTESQVFGLVVVLAVGCGAPSQGKDSGEADACVESPWNWQSVGDPFSKTWCTPCHHSALPVEARQGAPLEVNLETHELFVLWAGEIEDRVWDTDAPMPPMGVPPEEDRAALLEWLSCGAPE